MFDALSYLSQKVLNNGTKSDDNYDDFGVAAVKKEYYLFTFYVGLPFYNKN